MIDQKFNDLVFKRAETLDTLLAVSRGIADAEDYDDMVGAVRLVELAAEQARRAIIAEARAAEYQWEDLATALGVTAQEARAKFE